MTVRFYNPVASIFGLSSERKILGLSEPVAALALLIFLATLLTMGLRTFLLRRAKADVYDPDSELPLVTVSDIDFLNTNALPEEARTRAEASRSDSSYRVGD